MSMVSGSINSLPIRTGRKLMGECEKAIPESLEHLDLSGFENAVIGLPSYAAVVVVPTSTVI